MLDLFFAIVLSNLGPLFVIFAVVVYLAKQSKESALFVAGVLLTIFLCNMLAFIVYASFGYGVWAGVWFASAFPWFSLAKDKMNAQ